MGRDLASAGPGPCVRVDTRVHACWAHPPVRSPQAPAAKHATQPRIKRKDDVRVKCGLRGHRGHSSAEAWAPFPAAKALDWGLTAVEMAL